VDVRDLMSSLYCNSFDRFAHSSVSYNRYVHGKVYVIRKPGAVMVDS